MSKKPTVQLFYTAAFPPASRSRLESLLASSNQYFDYEPIHDPTFDGLSPSDLFRCRNFTFPRNYAVIADIRTLSELHSNMIPTLLVVSVRSITPQDEWDRYNSPGDISLLTTYIRLALLRALAEERVTLDPHTADWFWAEPHSRQYQDILWQVKTLRADPAGAHYACSVYAVKEKDMENMDEMHALYRGEAMKANGVFRGLPQRSEW
ncbi:hypothetical protein C8R43DRAFT_313404 [Mycena crocata]|nr:hypothetical protein C8R43DRAFT_313404 [Mycena crocata]